MSNAADIPSALGEMGGYRLERELAAGRTWLARAQGGRRVVLKMLESDCLLRGQLHPMIRDRLGRVRELAHLGVANLLGAERQDERAFLVWDYVEGQTLEEWLEQAERPAKALARELVLSIEALHALGIVHGALHERNVIVTPRGAVRLTHVSPLLYGEAEVDVQALMRILERMGCAASKREAGAGATSLRGLANELIAGSDADAGASTIGLREAGARVVEAGRGDRRTHWPAVVGAAIAALAGAALAWGLWHWAGRLGAA